MDGCFGFPSKYAYTIQDPLFGTSSWSDRDISSLNYVQLVGLMTSMTPGPRLLVLHTGNVVVTENKLAVDVMLP